MALQETFGEWNAFAVREETRDGPARPAEPADVPAGMGWSEDEIEYLAASSLTVPGRGERSEGCGDYLPLKFCPSCGEPEMLEKRCKQRTCPACHGIWTGEAAERATVRLTAAREAEADGLERRAVHVVVSPPEGEIETTGAFERGVRRAYELAKEHGVRGGTVIPHGYRVKEATKAAFREANPEMGIWRWLLEEREEDWRTLTYYSPHFHVVGLSGDVSASSPEEDGGWVVSRIRTLEEHNRRHVSTYEDTYGLFYYLLTHASFDPAGQSHVLRWFGSLSYRSFSAAEALPEWKVSQIERLARTVREDSGLEAPDYECREDECHGLLEPTYRNARERLADPEWCAEVGREKERRLGLAADWLANQRRPPPGLKHPRTQGDAREALDVMYEERYG